MAVGFRKKPPEPSPEDTVLWTMAKDARRLTATVRKIDAFDALELRFSMDGRFLESRMYRGAEIANLKPDAEAKREELRALGRQEAESGQ